MIVTSRAVLLAAIAATIAAPPATAWFPPAPLRPHVTAVTLTVGGGFVWRQPTTEYLNRDQITRIAGQLPPPAAPLAVSSCRDCATYDLVVRYAAGRSARLRAEGAAAVPDGPWSVVFRTFSPIT